MDQDQYTTRILLSNDWGIYRQLRLSALEKHPSFFMKKYFEEAVKSESAWRAEVSPEGGIVIGAFYKDELIGMTMILKGASPATQGYAISTASYVDFTHRQSGLFRILADQAIDWSRAQGFKGIMGSHRDGNKPIETAMNSYGFVCTDKKMADWADGKKAYEIMYRKDFV